MNLISPWASEFILRILSMISSFSAIVYLLLKDSFLLVSDIIPLIFEVFSIQKIFRSAEFLRDL